MVIQQLYFYQGSWYYILDPATPTDPSKGNGPIAPRGPGWAMLPLGQLSPGQWLLNFHVQKNHPENVKTWFSGVQAQRVELSRLVGSPWTCLSNKLLRGDANGADAQDWCKHFA